MAEEHEHRQVRHHNRNTPIIVLSVTAILISLMAAGFSTFVYLGMPQQIDSYIQHHKSELKGEKGDQGDRGDRGFTGTAGSNGSSGSSSLYCTTHNYTLLNSSTTSCY